MKNLEIANIFSSIAQILEIKSDNLFRIRAYERAVEILQDLDNIEEYAAADKLTEIPGIGKDLESKIKEYLSTGRIGYYEDLKKEVPLGILELLKVPSVGPKTAKLFYDELNIKDVATLEKFALEGKLLGLEGVKEKTVENILRGIDIFKRGSERIDIATAWDIAARFVSELRALKEVKRVEVAGSLRRMKETVKDIDILVASNKPQKVMDVFCGCAEVKDVFAKGITKSSVLSKGGVQVDARVVKPDSFGAALLYFTGSKNHNVKIRTIAARRNLKVNEYGVFPVTRKKSQECLASKTEEDLYKILKMQYIAPELREDTGEVEAALKNKLPKLIELKDIKGDLHAHSNYSDGKNTIREIVDAARKKGYEYIAISDHSQSLKVARGLSIADLKIKKKEIDSVNKRLKGFRVLFGTEVEIDSAGNIDYDDEILKEFDFVIAAIHSGFKQSKEQLSRRIIKACRNKNVDIIAHPTGRLWGARDSYELNFEEVFKAAKDTNTILEINSFPNRLDLGDSLIRLARQNGARFIINTDSHAVAHLDFMKFGVAMARRGWLTKQDVVNTLSLKDILKARK
ncbi:MAG: DNA polymerase/3'-5' exonuclease PolX [Candidatus Omnitrophica bacterium]|nr:DNA polymerase/3'-5' exonuclease PolX [Candidatus Omnitrophota bacterium]MDD5355873.1 DNA polymerase/3'-5' exonuclease PolX [Candidatus Omnitrophota bacterium]